MMQPPRPGTPGGNINLRPMTGYKANKVDINQLASQQLATKRTIPNVMITSDPVICHLITKNVESTMMHFPKNDVIKGPFHCVSEDCYYCRFVRPAVPCWIVPSFFPEYGDIRSLLVPNFGDYGRQDPLDLYSQVLDLLQTEEMHKVALRIRRDGQNRYAVERLRAPQTMMGNLAVVKQFLAAYEAGDVTLGDAFPAFPQEELARIPRIATHLEYELAPEDQALDHGTGEQEVTIEL